jgi:osomolarity two-component system sensor histidine kinase SLN1
MRQYPAVVTGFGSNNSAINNASSILTTTNENGVSVAVGYARPQSTLVSWLLVVEQSHAEAWEPIYKLRNIVLACVFGTVGLILLIVLPMAHFSVRPIARLRDATKNSIAPPGYSVNGSIHSETAEDGDLSGDEMADLEGRVGSSSQRSKKGFFVRLRNLGMRRKTKVERTEAERRRVFKIPAKVRDRKHWITDELTELTQTFNSMTDELMLQYQSLEDKVADRTRELEASKKSAEAANQSKTLFIANISHELKTPLNGILGMCALCMGETDLAKIQRSLQIAYKSGDLLLHLLNDLLTFSKNQIGQQLALDESEFRLIDIKTQLNTIFMKQVQDGKVNFSVKFLGTDGDPEAAADKSLPALGPHGTGRLKDMCLFGDVHRILQIIINLVGNSLKFTPPGGRVEVRIKCLGEAEVPTTEGSRNSMGSKQSSARSPRQRHDSNSNHSQLSRNASNPQKALVGTALAINPMEPKAAQRIQLRERSPASQPQAIPHHSCTLVFQIEVEDTGPGIPPDFRERVFEPFVQGDLGLSRKHGGTGLGLSICSQLASLMGGSIALVRSEEGVGSTFALKIPLRYTKSRTPSTSSSDAYLSRPQTAHDKPEITRASSQRDSTHSGSRTNFDKDPQPRLVGLSQPFFAAPLTPSPGNEVTEKQSTFDTRPEKDTPSKLRVLVAEDNLVNQEVVTRMLKLEDIYDVVIAKDGQEAFDMVKENMSKGQYFDLIFMDIQMPNLDGLQSTRLIRQMGYSAPIVALTAFAEESNVKECHEAGMDMFLSKPIRRPALKQVLKKFATILEEPEISSLKTGKSSSATSEIDPPAIPNDTSPKPSLANGVAPT